MDAFPDELLLEVLGRIDDGLTLLDVVPLVCKRWHRLSRDPCAWNSASVAIEGCSFDGTLDGWHGRHDNHSKILGAARVLVHAPALRRVSFSWDDPDSRPFSCSDELETLASALGRCAAEVREIVFPQPFEENGDIEHHEPLRHMLPEGRILLADFLSKKSSCVRYLKLGHMLRVGKPLLRALRQCENLEELHLMLPHPAAFKYRGDLRGQRLPKLKHLTLKSLFIVEDCRAFLKDLMGCLAQSVRHVRCEHHCESSEDVLAELSRCVELRSLRCGVEGVALAGTLPRLRSLSLVIFPGDTQRQQQALSAAEGALRGCGELQDLRDLRLHVCSLNRDAVLMHFITMLLTTLSTKATNLKHFSANCMLGWVVSPENRLVFLKSLPRLESVHFDCFNFDALPLLAEVEGLKRVSGEVICWKGEADVFRAALDQFKLQRPDVACCLTDVEDSFGGPTLT